MIFVITKFLPTTVLIFHLLSKLFVIKLSHGQASTEQQYSVNNTVLDEDMKEESLVVRKHITDHMQSKELMPYSIEINKNLYSSFKGALARHKEKFERKKCQTVISQKEKENG